MSELVWRKSSRSGRTDECVEVAGTEGSTAVRDSKNPRGAQLRVPAGRWRAFLARLKDGHYDV
jgi:hypothetical protein